MIGGSVNAHTHIYSGLAPLGMPAPNEPPSCFLEILERVWWKLDRALDESSLRSSAELYVAQALAFDTVGLIDHHESPGFIEGSLDVIADVCQSLGMPAVLCYGATERNGGREEAKRGLAECRRLLETNTRPLIRGAVGLHAGFTISDETIREAANLARELDTVLHVHVAEDKADVEDAKERGYQGIIDRFGQCDAMLSGSIFVHGVHLSPEEVTACADASIWLVQNPRSNQGNKVGYPQALEHTTLVALGTDGYPADMAAETQALLEAAQQANDAGDVGLRPEASAILLSTFWDGKPPLAKTAPNETTIARIKAQAQTQAARLWQRMDEI